jgi:hypothetical protein
VSEAVVPYCRYFCLLLPMLAFLMGSSPDTGRTSRASSTDRERNRQLLQKWKADPEHYARLEQDLRAFWALPAAKRQELRQLDEVFHQLDPATQKRLWLAAQRYLSWLERLPDDQRRWIEEAGDSNERLERIKTVRQRQWIEHLPKGMQEELNKLPAAERSARVQKLRQQERRQRGTGKPTFIAGSTPKRPAHLADFPVEVRTFVEKHLLPHLTAEEKQRLLEAEGRWPEFPQTIKELAKRHPVLPSLLTPQKPITHFEELPNKAKVEAGSRTSWERRTEAWNRLRKVEGKWPEWALTFHDLLTPKQRESMPPLGASRPEDFAPQVQTFIASTLKKDVTQAEWRSLKRLEGKWPDYPNHLLELAAKHNLEVPGLSLPGPAELWNNAR